MPSIDVNGVNLYYEQEGTGHPLVLIAGYTADISVWALVREELAKHFQLFLFDNRGVGRSDCPDASYTVEDLANDAHAFITTLNLNRPHVMGHSMGSAIAQTLAYCHPESVQKLILANPLIRFHESSTFAMRFFLELRASGVSPSKVFEGTLPWLFSGDFLKNPDMVKQILQMQAEYPYPQSLVGQRRQFEALLTFNSSAWMHKITAPTLVIAGSQDIVCPNDSQKLAESLPNARMVSFAKDAHMPLIENPQSFNQAVLKFL